MMQIKRRHIKMARAAMRCALNHIHAGPGYCFDAVLLWEIAANHKGRHA